MISIIICSRKKKIDPLLSKNIKESIGSIPYEIVWIDNSSNCYSIFSAYNRGVSLSKYDNLCFMHEDIVFHTTNWGQIVVDRLSDQKIGVVGVVGTLYIDNYTTSWISSGIIRGNLIQFNKKEGKSTTFHHNEYSFLGENVISVDGLWMCMRKSIFANDNIRWDDKLYKGFHFYDMDICLQAISKGYVNLIAQDILIEHKSMGNKDSIYYENCILFHNKWDYFLPQLTKKIPNDIVNEAKSNQLKGFCQMGTALYYAKKELNKSSHQLVTYLYNHFNKLTK